MLSIIAYVCAAFHDPKTGVEIFKIERDQLGRIIDVPEAVEQDVQFGWLKKDGSIRVISEKKEAVQLENDPMNGVTADGKSDVAAVINEAEEPEKEETEEGKKTRGRKSAKAE